MGRHTARMLRLAVVMVFTTGSSPAGQLRTIRKLQAILPVLLTMAAEQGYYAQRYFSSRFYKKCL